MTATTRILLIGNDLSGRDPVAAALSASGAALTTAADRAQALARAAAAADDAIVVDMRPDVIGLEIVRALRLAGVTRPVLFMAARDDAATCARSVAAGASALAVGAAAALAWLAQATDRAPAAAAPSIAGWQVDPVRHTVTAGTAAVPLTPDEYATFTTMAERPGVAVSRDRIDTVLQARRADRPASCADRLVHALRRKFADAGWKGAITTVRGAGYALAPAFG